MAIQKKYDEELLLKLPHLKLHKNYLPHIGKNFEDAKQRIMIVAERHYLEKTFDNLINAEHWYSTPEKVYSTIGDNKSWFNTRSVVAKYLQNRTSKGGLSIFYNLEKSFKNVFPEADLFNDCVYINYYQRPSQQQGNSINVSAIDSKIALENFMAIFAALKISKVIFVSSKAYCDFKAMPDMYKQTTLPFIGSVPHPSASSWWNRKSLKYGINGTTATGKEKFERIIKPKV